jgi:hypothetical protein
MGALATGIQWTVGAVLALGVIALLIAPFAAVWVIGIAIAALVAVGVWGVRLQRRTSGASPDRGEDRGAERTPAEQT